MDNPTNSVVWRNIIIIDYVYVEVVGTPGIIFEVRLCSKCRSVYKLTVIFPRKYKYCWIL
jgi:hypothetical protein